MVLKAFVITFHQLNVFQINRSMKIMQGFSSYANAICGRLGKGDFIGVAYKNKIHLKKSFHAWVHRLETIVRNMVASA